MSVSAISTVNFLNGDTPTSQGRMQQFRQVFQQLGQDLQSGNLSAAQSDILTLQESVVPAASASSSSTKDRIAQDSARSPKVFNPGISPGPRKTTRQFNKTLSIGPSIATITTAEARRVGSARSLAG